uniref:Putative secreted protein n=1 Tax=Anopheles darlingi TaxID=43151 RepID=A0A2M4DJD2_ANODA
MWSRCWYTFFLGSQQPGALSLSFLRHTENDALPFLQSKKNSSAQNKEAQEQRKPACKKCTFHATTFTPPHP